MNKWIAFVLGLLIASTLVAAEPTIRGELALAEESLSKGDRAGYLDHMKKVIELEPDRLSRTFYLYGLARAYAMNGDDGAAVKTLETIWGEQIEAPMVALGDHDPAFQSTRSTRAYKSLQQKFDSMDLAIMPVAGSVVQISGAGCNLAASVGDDGVLLVDSGYDKTAKAIMKALRSRRPDAKIRYIINTHEHIDHTGGNHLLGAGAVIVAHERARAALEKPQEFVADFQIPAIDRDGLPDVTTDGRLSIHFNGEKVIVAAIPAHTAGDLVVYFTGSKVLHMGDDYFPGTRKFLFPGTGIDAFFSGMTHLLSEVADDAVVLTGHTEPVSGAELKAIFAKTDGMYRFVREGLNAGKTLEQLIALGESKGYPGDWLGYYFSKMKKSG